MWLLGTIGGAIILAYSMRTDRRQNGPLILATLLFLIIAVPTFAFSYLTERNIWEGKYGLEPYEAPDGFMIHGSQPDDPQP